MLSKANRVRSANAYSTITKSGSRSTTPTLVLYTYHSTENHPVQFGLIINKSVGGSVTRHKIARQLRHIFRDYLTTFPPGTQLVIRVLKDNRDYRSDFSLAVERAERAKVKL